MGSGMSVQADDTDQLPRAEPKPWPRWWFWAPGTIVTLVVAALLGWWAYAGHYQPLTTGSTWGIHDGMRDLTDGVSDTHTALVGPPGTTGRLLESLANDGRTAVRVEGVDLEGLRGPTRAEWVPLPDSKRCMGCIDERRPFPVTIPAHGEIGIVLTFVKPRCADPGSYQEVSGYQVRFRAYGVHHTTWMTLPLTGLLCPSAAALRHVEP
jgi:hypothetical protein